MTYPTASGVIFRLVILAALTTVSAAEGPQSRPTEAQTVAGFEARLKDYQALHQKLEATLPKLPRQPTPEQMDQHRLALGKLIRLARHDAKPGELFTGDVQAVVRRILAEALSDPDGKSLKASIMDENPGVPKLLINQTYPSSLPLSTMPPQLLASLPKLPEELEYHFNGSRLILLDIHAGIVVDRTEDVLPR
ncbi:MAG: hypothetical protein L0170_15175 [Acidobacteria bacterium]|nr:hypothetical protein [Acidobacteriota bacterium]